MRTPPFLLATCLLLVLGGVARAEEPPTPRLDAIDYARPKAQLVLGPRVGAGQRTLGIARQLAAKGKTPQGTLSQIVRWVGRNLRADASKLGSWRGADQIVMDGTVSGDAERAFMIGVFARAAGIPATWVKSLPSAWLRADAEKWRGLRAPVGRVFLEVHLGRSWALLDPVTARLYERYETSLRELPDDHLAFDKGGDPYALVLPHRFELWRAQASAFARRLAPPAGPWSQARDLLAPWRVYIAGQGGPATYAREACKTLGFLVEKSFNSKHETWLDKAAGTTVIVTVGREGPRIPRALWARYLGPAAATYEAGGKPDKPWIKRTLPDGTRVILITVTEYGPVELAVSEALEG